MNAIRIALALVLLSSIDGFCQSKYVTLVVNANAAFGSIIASNSISIASNEVATVSGLFAPGDSMDCEIFLSGVTSTRRSASSPGIQPLTGPAQITVYPRLSTTISYITLEIAPAAFPPGQTIILPEGTVGTIHVESSTNLVTWNSEWAQTFANTNENRFFRLRAERSLP